MQKVRGHPTPSKLGVWGSHRLQAKGFRYYFTPLTGVLFNFPSRYWCTIGHEGVFSLGPWSDRIPTGFHVSRGTRVLRAPSRNGLRLQDWSPSLVGRSRPFNWPCGFSLGEGSELPSPEAPQPAARNAFGLEREPRFGCSPFARRY